MPLPTERSPLRLVVEGDDDRHVAVHLLKRHGWDCESKGLFVSHAESWTQARDAFAVALKGSLRRIGVVLDADDDVAARWGSLRQVLLGAGYEVPTNPPESGYCVDGRAEVERVGVWLMPDNVSSGALEDFLFDLVPTTDACWPIAQESVDRAALAGAPFKPKDAKKARLHTWLAWRERPGIPYGIALRATDLGHTSPAADAFAAWVRRLYD